MWDQAGERIYEYGVSYGVLYLPNGSGIYDTGFAWNGLTTVTESPTGAEANPQYADNIKYLNLLSTEQFGATVEAFTYPEEWGQCDGTISPEPGVAVGQQTRKPFGLSYQTRVGNDLLGTDFGYKIHLIYNALAAPSEKAYATINDSPEAIAFSWDVTTTPVVVGTGYKPTASITIDSTKVDPSALTVLEDLLYGTVGIDPALPTPAEVLTIFAGTLTVATPTAPTYNSSTKVITIPSITGVIYKMDGVTLSAGAQAPITADKIVTAHPASGYKFPPVIDDDWFFDF
jgi:hypothetical protein